MAPFDVAGVSAAPIHIHRVFFALVGRGGIKGGLVCIWIHGCPVVDVEDSSPGKRPCVGGVFQLIADYKKMSHIDRKGCKADNDKNGNGDQNHHDPFSIPGQLMHP